MKHSATASLLLLAASIINNSVADEAAGCVFDGEKHRPWATVSLEVRELIQEIPDDRSRDGAVIVLQCGPDLDAERIVEGHWANRALTHHWRWQVKPISRSALEAVRH